MKFEIKKIEQEGKKPIIEKSIEIKTGLNTGMRFNPQQPNCNLRTRSCLKALRG